MRYRPNENRVHEGTKENHENDLYRALEPTFDHFIQPEDPDRYSLRNETYVSNSTIEAGIQRFCTGKSNAASFFIGATGIGKSTLLRHTLQLNRSPQIIGDTLYILFSLNQRHIQSEDSLRSQLGAVLLDACWLVKSGESSQLDEIDLVNFTKFIKDASSDLLNAKGLDLTKPPLERARQLASSSELQYQFAQSALKFFASQSRTLNHIVFILDDLEMKTHDRQEEAVRNAIETMYCLRNFGRHRSTSVRLLIALRPETHAWISRLEQVVTTSFRRIDYRTPVSIYQIFEKRFDAVFIRDDYAHIRDRSRLQQALDVLNAVGTALSDRFSERIVKLHNYNLRDSLESFYTIISNREWMQRENREYEPHFRVEAENFAISGASVLRALGMGEDNIYPMQDTCISNLLWNTKSPSSDLLLLYVVKYFLTRGNQPESRSDSLSLLSQLLGFTDAEHTLSQVFDYAVRSQLLHLERSNGVEMITLTPRAQELHVMLGEASILLELFRDDMCIPERGGRPQKPTRLLSGPVEGFSAIAELISDLWDSEARLRSGFSDAGAIEAGSSYFGTSFEAARMRAAFLHSMTAFYRTEDWNKWPSGIQSWRTKLLAKNLPSSTQ